MPSGACRAFYDPDFSIVTFEFATNMGTNPNSIALIGDIAADLGFGLVRTFEKLSITERLAKQHPVMYFLCDYSPDFEKTKRQIAEIRSSYQLRVRFAPCICFIESPSKDRIIECIHAGFDDILTLPWSVSKFHQRLTKQMNSKNIYFETDSYFGPDRRRYNKDPQKRGDTAPAKGFGYRRYEFVRNNVTGIQIMHDFVVGKSPKRQSAVAFSAMQF